MTDSGSKSSKLQTEIIDSKRIRRKETKKGGAQGLLPNKKISYIYYMYKNYLLCSMKTATRFQSFSSKSSSVTPRPL